MITIKAPKIAYSDGKATLSAEVEVGSEGRKVLWFTVDGKYGQYLCAERADAFVLGVLRMAMWEGHDIVSEAPMTDRLYEQLTEQFLPAFYKANEFDREPANHPSEKGFAAKIVAPLAPEVETSGTAVGTGVSCGVDSLHVFATHPDITHACVWNAHIPDVNETDETRKAGFADMVERASRFCEETKHELITADTNFDRGGIGCLRWENMTTFGNLFCVYCLQKLFRKYYIASDCSVLGFNFRLPLYEDCAHYEFFLFPHVSLPHLSIRMDGHDCRRVEKIRDLLNYPPARQFLNVCWRLRPDHRNCSCHCEKCMRTMLALYALGALDGFPEFSMSDTSRRISASILPLNTGGAESAIRSAANLRRILSGNRYPFQPRLAHWRSLASGMCANWRAWGSRKKNSVRIECRFGMRRKVS